MDSERILLDAEARIRGSGRRHAGDLTPEEAHILLREHPGAKLVDVRSHPELDFAGFVEGCCHVPWKLYPGMTPNPCFDDEIWKIAQQDDLLLLLCRTGGRSLEAAEHLAKLGYQKTYNILGGFEGRPDHGGQRGKMEGWKARGLPWKHR